MPMGQHTAGPMPACTELPHQGHSSRQVDDPREPATVDLGSHDNRELFPDPPNVLSRPRIRKRTTRLAPHPKWSPARAQILPEAGSTAKAVLLVSPTRDLEFPPLPPRAQAKRHDNTTVMWLLTQVMPGNPPPSP